MVEIVTKKQMNDRKNSVIKPIEKKTTTRKKPVKKAVEVIE